MTGAVKKCADSIGGCTIVAILKSVRQKFVVAWRRDERVRLLNEKSGSKQNGGFSSSVSKVGRFCRRFLFFQRAADRVRQTSLIVGGGRPFGLCTNKGLPQWRRKEAMLLDPLRKILPRLLEDSSWMFAIIIIHARKYVCALPWRTTINTNVLYDAVLIPMKAKNGILTVNETVHSLFHSQQTRSLLRRAVRM